MAKPIPEDRLFSEEHEWIKIEGQEGIIGISDHAQSSLGDVVYIELPDVGINIKKGSAIGVLESVKAVSDIYAPMSGKIKAINQNVLDQPEKINQDPYGEGWLLMIEIADGTENSTLLNPAEYKELIDKEAK